MSKIIELIQQRYPYTNLGDVTTEHTTRNNSRLITEVRSVTNSVGLVKTGDYFENSRTSQDTSNYKVVEPGMLVYNPSRINVGSIARLSENIPVIVSPMYVVVSIDSEKVLPEYLELYLTSEQGKSQILSKVEVGARFRLTYQSFARIQLPLPPIHIQKDIVGTLNKFTSLESKLVAELEARKSQFEYYRDKLMTFEGQSDIKFQPLGEIGEFIRGKRFTKADYVDEGIGVIHYGEIYTHYGTAADKVISHVNRELKPKLRFAMPGDVVITDVGETVDDVGKAVAWIGSEDVAIHDHCYAFRHMMNPKFVSYYMQTAKFRSDKAKYVARTKVNTLLINGLAKVCMPAPPMAEQDRIVSILDKFDMLVNNISKGLPAEISTRRKQYDYYRNRLLTLQGAAA